MVYVLSAVVSAVPLLLAVGVLTGRVKVNGCCALADPRCDLRMRDAFTLQEDSRAASRPVQGDRA